LNIFDDMTLPAYAGALGTWIILATGCVIARQKAKLSLVAIAAERLDSSPIRLQGKPVQIAQLRIYGFCIALAMCLFSLFSALNFWRGYFPFPSSETVAGGHTLIAYVWLTLGLITPLFYALQVALERVITRESIRQCCLAFQPILHLLFFTTALFYILPLVEAVKLTLGLSSLHIDVVRFFIALSAVIGIWPVLPIFIMVFFKSSYIGAGFREIGSKDFIFRQPFLNAPLCPILFTVLLSLPSSRASLKGMRTKDLIFQIQFLNAQDFSLELLESKPDQDIDTLIAVARFSRNMEKAELISNYLLNRHVNLLAE
jgi:hypothetical protein